MRVLVCGGRHWSDKAPIRNVLNLIPKIEVLIEGEARGADRLAKKVAGKRKIPVKELSAKWDKHGKAAGPIRNRKMLDEGDPDIVLAFHRNLEKSKGTRDMLQKAVSEGVPAAVCRE
ncbi:hypothetical protein AKJ61_00830 [candidate division MSBL1 archaeon SCGC-AAA259B11]|uniref:YspA cpYpsA-related SLOG domain-containing protein n=1 Tax=candidate division MSBL1 archaeon SCGC-AAA259B11 TaxID=1698260 RepID=A0A133U866_9EURY|nr:hypothetical protein AKJ61_00830 [candidate division MSBL1 archaeon SCGC-AAA259B11]